MEEGEGGGEKERKRGEEDGWMKEDRIRWKEMRRRRRR